MRRVIFQSPDLEVVHVAGDASGPVVITFDSFADRHETTRAGFGEHFFAKRGIDAYHVVQFTNRWYQLPEMEEVLDTIRREIAGDRAVITYGSSMGGYAAYRFSGILGAATIVAFSPQFSIDQRKVPWEDRWQAWTGDLPSLWDDLPVARDARCILFFDPAGEDGRHAALIANAFSRPSCIAIAHGGHPCIAVLAELDLLEQTVLSVIRGDFVPDDLRAALAAKRHTSAVLGAESAFRMRLLQFPRRIRLVEDAIARSPESPLNWGLRGMILASCGHDREAERSFQISLSLAPDVPVLLYRYLAFLEDRGRMTEVDDVGARILELDPQYRHRLDNRHRRRDRMTARMERTCLRAQRRLLSLVFRNFKAGLACSSACPGRVTIR